MLVKKITKLIVFGLFCFAFFARANFAGAEVVKPYGNRDMSAPIDLNEAYLLPGIYATDLAFTKNNQTLTGSFNILNNENETIGGLQYQIEILDSQQNLYDIFPVRDQMTLSSKEKRKISFSYALPSLPSGAYSFRIQIVSNGGRYLGWDDLPLKIENGTNNFIKVSAISISLPQFKTQNFEPESGPNVSPSSQFFLKANLKNLGNMPITVVPNLDIYSFDIAKGNGVSIKQNPITINPGQETSFDFPVTASQMSGVYSGLLYFTDINGNKISSVGEYRFVVMGASADILPMKISHIALLKGDQTVINLDFVGAPDAETITQGNLDVKIVDDKGIAGEAQTSNLKLTDAVSSSQARINLIRDLTANPKIVAEITDQNGNILTSSSVNIELPSNFLQNQNKMSKTKELKSILEFMAGIILFCFAMLIILKRKINLKKISFFIILAVVSCSLFVGLKASATGNGNGIEVFTPTTPASFGGNWGFATSQENTESLVELFINAPIHDAPAGTYPRNAVPLQYRVTYVVCANSITYVRVIGRFDLNGGKQTTLLGTNANWQVVHNVVYTDHAVCPNGAHSCFLSQDFSGSLDLSSLPSTACSTTLQMVAKIGLGAWGSVPPDETIELFAPAYANAVNLWINFPCNTPPPPPNPAILHVVKVVVNQNGGAATPSSFNLHVEQSGADVAGSPAAGVGTPGTSYTLSAGTYTVSEDYNASYTGAFSGDCDANGNITLTSGDNKTCTVTNTDIPSPPPPPPPPPVCTVNCGGAPLPPVIKVTKVANPTSLIISGPITYSYAVSNPGPVVLSNITVVDDKCSPVVYISGDTNNNLKMETTETWNYSCATTLFQTTTNTVTATGQNNGSTVTDTAKATVTVTVPKFPNTGSTPIHITKVPNPSTLPVLGGMVLYTYNVTNPGTLPLSNVSVVDDKCSPVQYVSGDANLDSKLDPTETWIYNCQTKLTQTTTNTATASGIVNGQTVTDSAVATVTVPLPGFPKTGFSPFSENSPYGIFILLGDALVIIAAFVIIFKEQNV